MDSIVENQKEISSNNTFDKDSNKISANLIRKPPFQKSRLDFKAKVEPTSIKEIHRPNLEKLSLLQLKDLLKKQEQIIHNKKLLSNLKDKGAKVTSFCNEIKEQIKIREQQVNQDIVTTEKMFKELSIEKEKTLQYKDAYSENRARLLNQNKMNKRFNLPKKLESIIKVENQPNIEYNKEISIKIELPREIKMLTYEESLKRLEITTEKEKNVLCDQLMLFYTYRTRNDEPEDFDDLDDSDDSDYNDADW